MSVNEFKIRASHLSMQLYKPISLTNEGNQLGDSKLVMVVCARAHVHVHIPMETKNNDPQTFMQG